MNKSEQSTMYFAVILVCVYSCIHFETSATFMLVKITDAQKPSSFASRTIKKEVFNKPSDEGILVYLMELDKQNHFPFRDN